LERMPWETNADVQDKISQGEAVLREMGLIND
jgi:hypothetical protein